MGLASSMERLGRRIEGRLARHGEDAGPTARIGLGVVILLAGVHKLVDPAAWGTYLAPWFAARWPVDVGASMVVFGLTEVVVAPFLVLDRYAAIAATVVAVSMAGVLVDLIVLIAQTGEGADVLIRDLGLLVLATGVALREAGTA